MHQEGKRRSSRRHTLKKRKISMLLRQSSKGAAARLALMRQSSSYSAAPQPLNREWSELVTKELKGKKTPESLTWQTPEVRKQALLQTVLVSTPLLSFLL